VRLPGGDPRTVFAEAVALGRACLERLIEIEFVDRSIALASLTFTSLIPLGVVIGALSPIDSDGFAAALNRRFELTGSTAQLVTSVFAPPGDVRSTVSVIGLLLLIGSALSFVRGLQRVYERSWRLRSRGVRATPSGLLWLAAVVAAVLVLVPLRQAVDDAAGPVVGLVVVLATGALVWLLTPFVLLARRVPGRALVPTALITAVGMSALGTASIVYMPRAIADSADRYGMIGIAIALVSWLVGVGFVLVISAAVGAVLGERRAGPTLPAPELD
jgi:membrane protein